MYVLLDWTTNNLIKKVKRMRQIFGEQEEGVAGEKQKDEEDTMAGANNNELLEQDAKKQERKKSGERGITTVHLISKAKLEKEKKIEKERRKVHIGKAKKSKMENLKLYIYACPY